MGKSNLVVVRLNMKCFAKSNKALGLQNEDGQKWMPFSQISQISVNDETDREVARGEQVEIGDLVNDLMLPEWLAKVHDLQIIGG